MVRMRLDLSYRHLSYYLQEGADLPKVVHQRYPKTGEASPRIRVGVLELEKLGTTWIDLGVYPYEYLVRVQWLPPPGRSGTTRSGSPDTLRASASKRTRRIASVSPT